jgi:hypothetical protein
LDLDPDWPTDLSSTKIYGGIKFQDGSIRGFNDDGRTNRLSILLGNGGDNPGTRPNPKMQFIRPLVIFQEHNNIFCLDDFCLAQMPSSFREKR